MLKISIPKPCHEDWNAMTPNQQGRHCSSCAKTVVDFTSLSDEEVKNFFINKKDERVCGRFNNTQLHRIVIELPKDILQLQMPFWKRFLAACLIVFSTTLFSCDTATIGAPLVKQETTAAEITTLAEATDRSSGYVGMISFDSSFSCSSPVPDSTLQVPEIITKGETVFQGDIYLAPEKPPVIDSFVVPMMGTPIVVVPDTSRKLIADTVVIKCKLKDPPKADTSCNNVFY